MESTASLLEAIRLRNDGARDLLIERYLPRLQRWARGQLHFAARDLVDTDDLVQLTFIRALNRLEEFKSKGEGAFFAYLRKILKNQLRDQMRRVQRRPGNESLHENMAGNCPSPLEQAIGKENLEVFETALCELSETQQEAVLLRMELGFTYREVAEALGCPSPNAARMMIKRSIVRLAELMDRV